jgi:hypothetical protein
MMLSLCISTLILFFAPQYVPMVVKLDPGTTHLLAAVLCLGTGCCVMGFTLGSRFFFPNTDLRNCYRLAMSATPSNVAALGTFLVTIGQAVKWDPLLTLYSASSTLFLLIAHIWVTWDLYWEVKRINDRVCKAVERAKADG